MPEQNYETIAKNLIQGLRQKSETLKHPYYVAIIDWRKRTYLGLAQDIYSEICLLYCAKADEKFLESLRKVDPQLTQAVADDNLPLEKRLVVKKTGTRITALTAAQRDYLQKDPIFIGELPYGDVSIINGDGITKVKSGSTDN